MQIGKFNQWEQRKVGIDYEYEIRDVTEFSILKKMTSPHLFIQHIQACHHVMAVVLRWIGGLQIAQTEYPQFKSTLTDYKC